MAFQLHDLSVHGSLQSRWDLPNNVMVRLHHSCSAKHAYGLCARAGNPLYQNPNHQVSHNETAPGHEPNDKGLPNNRMYCQKLSHLLIEEACRRHAACDDHLREALITVAVASTITWPITNPNPCGTCLVFQNWPPIPRMHRHC